MKSSPLRFNAQLLRTPKWHMKDETAPDQLRKQDRESTSLHGPNPHPSKLHPFVEFDPGIKIRDAQSVNLSNLKPSSTRLLQCLYKSLIIFEIEDQMQNKTTKLTKLAISDTV